MQNVTTGCILNLEHSNSALHCDCARKQIAIDQGYVQGEAFRLLFCDFLATSAG